MVLCVHATEKKIYGLNEKVMLPELGNIVIKAKLDTGAKTSSLGATNIKIFKRNGEHWVRFKPQIKGKDLPEIERLLVRHSQIKRRVADIVDNDDDALLTKRPVILMNMCFDGQLHAIEVNLTDRSHFIYPLLLGSTSLISLKAIVDPSIKYQAIIDCK